MIYSSDLTQLKPLEQGYFYKTSFLFGATKSRNHGFSYLYFFKSHKDIYVIEEYRTRNDVTKYISVTARKIDKIDLKEYNEFFLMQQDKMNENFALEICDKEIKRGNQDVIKFSNFYIVTQTISLGQQHVSGVICENTFEMAYDDEIQNIVNENNIPTLNNSEISDER